MDFSGRNAEAIELFRSQTPANIKDRADVLKALDEVYVSTDSDEQLDMELELVVARILDPTAKEGYAVAVLGPSGAGKSTLVNRRLDAMKQFAPMDDGYGNEVQFCLRVQTPSSCTAKALGTAILKATGYPLERTPSEDDIWNIIRKRLRLKMHKVIFLDEFQHVLKGPKAKGGAHLTNTVKLLMQDPEWPVWLIVAGVPDVMQFVERDEWFQMERRVRPIEIDNLENAEGDIENMRAIVEAMVGPCRMELAFPTTDDFLRRLMHGGLWRFGMAVQLVKMSIEVALWDDNAAGELKLDHFVKGYKRLSNCGRDSNVFTAENWHLIERQVTPRGRLTPGYTLSRAVGA